MIRNVSYNNKEVFSEITDHVGKAFTFRQRMKLGGTGSQRLLIKNASSRITELLDLDTNLNYCNIELRNKGVIVRFRSILETFAWVIPYEKLNITRKTGVFSLNDGDLYVDLAPAYNASFNKKFFNKLMNLKFKGFEHILTIK
jgi:hypothetical protein